MNAYLYFQQQGKEKCQRILDSAPINAPLFARFYSEETGSYYNTNKNNSVSLRELKNAIKDFEELDAVSRKIRLGILKPCR